MSFRHLGRLQTKKSNLREAMSGEKGAERVRKYSLLMAAELVYNSAAVHCVFKATIGKRCCD